MANGKGGSHILKRLTDLRDKVEHLIWWQVQEGSCNLWYDNWTQQGALSYIEEGGQIRSDLEVNEFKGPARWDLDKVGEVLSEEMVEHIRDYIKPLMEN